MSNPIHQSARAQDAERTALESRGLRAAGNIGLAVRVAVIKAYRDGRRTGPVIRKALADFAPAITDAMTAGHLQGRLRSLLTAKAAMSRGTKLANPYGEAIKAIQRRLDLSDAEIRAVQAAYSKEAATVTGEVAGLLEEHVKRAVAQAVSDGVHTRGGVQLIREAFDAAGVTPANSYTFENVYRTQVQVAYGAGRWQANQTEAVQEILWGYEYSAVMDSRTRPTHAAMDGTRAPKDDPLWREWWPPCGYSCRCSVVEIFDGDREAVEIPPLPSVTIDGAKVKPGPDEGWDFNPGIVFEVEMA